VKPILNPSGRRVKVFLDSSLIVAGIGSETGASGVVLDLCEAELVLPVISKQVVVEIDRAVSAKLPHLTGRLRNFLLSLRPILVEDFSLEHVNEALQQVHAKDASILAAAKEAGVDYLVTLDRKHFLAARPKVQLVPPVVSPGEFLQLFEAWCRETMS
jgi:predicted nucleic acid-binding protein